MEALEILAGCPLFYEIYEKEVRKILSNCKVRSFQPGDVIISEGEHMDHLYIVLHGELVAQRVTGERTLEVQTLSVGDFFGEFAFTQDQTALCDVIAKQKSEVVALPFEHVIELYNKDVRTFGVLTYNLLQTVLRNFETANKIIFRLNQQEEVKIRPGLYQTKRSKLWSPQDRNKQSPKSSK